MNSGYLLKGTVAAIIICLFAQYLPAYYRQAEMWYVLIAVLGGAIVYLSLETYMVTKRFARKRA